MNLVKLEVKNVYAVGDLHGEFNSILYNIKKSDLTDSCILFAGDIGFGFNKDEYYKQIFSKISKVLSKRNIHLVFVRGNHDDVSYFDGKHYTRYKYIHVVSDYTVVQIVSDYVITHNILCIGGATSIDRKYRISTNNMNMLKYKMYHAYATEEEVKKNAPKCYWEGERPVYNYDLLDDIKDNGILIDTVCSHTCPSFCQPLTKDGIVSWSKYDDELFDDIDRERETMDMIYNHIIKDGHPLKNWIYGHYHYYNCEVINGVMYRMLDMCRNGNFNIVELI